MAELVTTSGEAAAVVNRMYQLSPAWLDRAVKRGPRRVREDIQHHLDFLAAAEEQGDPGLFDAYTDWTRRVEQEHGMSAEALAAMYETMAHVVGPGVRQDMLQRNLARLRQPLEPSREHEEPVGQVQALTAALLQGDRPAAGRILQGADPATLADHLVQPALEEIGRLWETGEITVAAEHLATSTCRDALARLEPPATEPRAPGRAVLACIEGNRHAVGLGLLAYRLEQAGWTVHLLGADVPLDDLVAHVREHQPTVVCLSLALPSHLIPARRAVEAVRRAGAQSVIVGGCLVRDYPETGRLTGADAWPQGVHAALVGLTDSPPEA